MSEKCVLFGCKAVGSGILSPWTSFIASELKKESAQALENHVQEDELWNSRMLRAVGKEGMTGHLEFEGTHMSSI